MQHSVHMFTVNPLTQASRHRRSYSSHYEATSSAQSAKTCPFLPAFCGLCVSVEHNHELQRLQDAAWHVEVGGPKEPCIKWDPDSPEKWQFFWGGAPPVMQPFIKILWLLVNYHAAAVQLVHSKLYHKMHSTMHYESCGLIHNKQMKHKTPVDS